MNKIFFNRDGWVCQRYPYDLHVEDESLFLEVDNETYSMTLSTASHYAWRVKNGKLINEQYEAIPQSELIESRISQLKIQLAGSDYKAIKYIEGQTSEAEYAPVRELRKRLRDEINALEQQM